MSQRPRASAVGLNPSPSLRVGEVQQAAYWSGAKVATRKEGRLWRWATLLLALAVLMPLLVLATA